MPFLNTFLGCFWLIVNIVLKKGKPILKIVGIGQASIFFHIVQMRTILSTRKEFVIIIWPNRDDSDHILIVTIDVDVGDGRTIRTNLLPHRSKLSKYSIYDCIGVAL
jgi:hypothetical protein